MRLREAIYENIQNDKKTKLIIMPGQKYLDQDTVRL